MIMRVDLFFIGIKLQIYFDINCQIYASFALYLNVSICVILVNNII